jgi:hypothetical protein
VLDHREHVVKISSPLTTTSGEFQTIKVYDILLKTMMTIKHHNIASLRGHDSLWDSLILLSPVEQDLLSDNFEDGKISPALCNVNRCTLPLS